jgi:penicillin-binding protein 2
MDYPVTGRLPSKIQRPDHLPDLRRLKLFYALILGMMGVMIARLWYLQIANGAEMALKSEQQRTRSIRKVAARGVIEDAKGRVLATSHSQYVVSVIPEEIKKNPQSLENLARILKVDLDALAAKVKAWKRMEPCKVAEKVDMPVLTQIEEQKLDLAGVIITKDPIRFYMDNRLCTHVLGVTRPISEDKLDAMRADGYTYFDRDYIGVEGLEATYETDLRGQDGEQLVAVDARGRMLHTLSETLPTPGHTLRLTLDTDLQKVAYEALQEPLSTGHCGAAIALDPNTGAVLALVSTPSYDLNAYGTGYNSLLKDPLKPLINRASGSAYPVGSTFKLVTAAAGLETGVISESSREYCPGHLQVGNRIFHCDKLSGHGSIAFENAIGASCDVYFYKTGQRVGVENLAEWARRFGLGERTGIDLPVDSRGIIPTPEWKKKTKRGPWVPGDVVNMAIGQGYVGVTPLQLADYTAALANGGTLWRPQLVQEIVDTSGERPVTLHHLTPESRGSLGVSAHHRDAIVEGMRRTLEPGGTAYGSAIPNLEVAGKTGSAQVVWHGEHVTNSVFVCFAPIDQPKIAIAVLVEGAGHGADVAAPIARRMLNQYFHLKLDNAAVPIGRRSGAD